MTLIKDGINPADMIMQLDADRLAWAFANLDKTVEQCQIGINNNIEALKVASGVKKINLHVSLGNKGGREVIATVKGYQANRVDTITKEKRERITLLRHYIAGITGPEFQGVEWLNQEADDGLCQMQGLSYNSVLCSDDKDLRMVEGWHYNHRTGKYWFTDAFGWLEIQSTEKTKKVWGCGTKWFWAQLLMGDQVDNIPGLPTLAVASANKWFPIKNPKNRKPKSCGAMTAYGVLETAENDDECYKRVWECYLHTYGDEAHDRFFEQAFLLWMRREETVWDVLKFLRPLGFVYNERKHKQVLLPWTNDYD